MFFIMVVVHSFKRHLLEYVTFRIYSYSIPLCGVGIMSVICALCKDVDECYQFCYVCTIPSCQCCYVVKQSVYVDIITSDF
jgi:hypothetical protein